MTRPVLRLGVVVVAAGAGTRLGTHVPKALVEVAGRPLLAHALAGLAAAGLPAPVVVHQPDARGAFASAAGRPVAALVPGAAERTGSVRAGVAALPEDVEVVVVHDAARPLVPPAVCRAAVAAVTGPETGPGPERDHGRVLAAAPGLPVADTLKRVEGRRVLTTVPRDGLVGVQTPQVFVRSALETALAAAEAASDELGLIEALIDAGRLTGRVVVVPGSFWAHKVTYPDDLEVVAALAAVPGPRSRDA